MSGSTTGRLFCLTSFGESHGPAIGGVVDGCPPGLEISEADLQKDLDRRRPGQSKYVTQRKEPDTVRILSGVFEGRTTGTPIGFIIDNVDQKSKDYGEIKDRFRPNHADFAYQQKYGIRDYRGGGRASARETAVRVAAGAIARKWLQEKFGVTVRGYCAQIGELKFELKDWDAVEQNPFFCPDPTRVPEIEKYINAIRKEGDSIGARINVVAEGLPAGWGEPVYDRLDADLAKALMGINAAKAVEIGDGFAVVEMRGSEHRDEITSAGFTANHSGGVTGGISTGQPLTASVAFKPTSSILIPGRSIDAAGSEVEVRTIGRHDPCVGIRATPIVEAMTLITLMDLALRNSAVMA